MPVNGSVAPVCPISRSQAPSAHAASPVAIPRPTDLPSAIAAVNQLITILNPLVINNLGFPYIPKWQEVQRNVQTVRIFNPNDREQWIDVERITNLVFLDKSTDALFQWNYKLPKGTTITPNR
jgi:hypothetical protein